MATPRIRQMIFLKVRGLGPELISGFNIVNKIIPKFLN